MFITIIGYWSQRFSPLLAATLVPGASVVPLADPVMFLIFRRSTAIAPFSLMSLLVMRWHSFRFLTRFRRHSLARALTRLRLRLEPFLELLTLRRRANLQTQICYHSLTIRKGNVHRHGPPPKPEGSRNPRAAPQYPEVLCQQGQNPPLPKRRRTAPL